MDGAKPEPEVVRSRSRRACEVALYLVHCACRDDTGLLCDAPDGLGVQAIMPKQPIRAFIFIVSSGLSMAQPENITINGTTYAFSTLSDAARGHVASIQAVDGEIARLQLRIGIAQTARNAYVNALAASLPAEAPADDAQA